MAERANLLVRLALLANFLLHYGSTQLPLR